MKFLSLGLGEIPWPEQKAAATIDLNTLIRRLEAIYETTSGIGINPENCMQSPTVHAIVTGISRGVATSPVHVYQKTLSQGRVRKEQLESHPVERLLNKPNDWQTKMDYWYDATSCLMRYGRYTAYKARGLTGPIRRLIPLHDSVVTLKQDPSSYEVTVEVQQPSGAPKTYAFSEMHHARGPARDFLKGDSSITDVREAIGLEIAAEKFGASFFGGGAMPGIVFKFMEGFSGFKTDEERKKFVDEFQAAYNQRGRFRSMLMPKGIEMDKAVGIENDKAQFIEARKYQRTVIAGAFGMPPYMVGDLERQTFNNAEQQATNKVQEVLLPIVRIFETAMERDLLTDQDRSSGVMIRFNLDGMLRGDFKTRQEGLNIQRQAGVINANDWRENENMNPIPDEDGGEEYWRQGPSGQTANPGGAADPGTTDPTQPSSAANG